MLTDRSAVRLTRAPKPSVATSPETFAIRIGPPSCPGVWRPVTTSSQHAHCPFDDEPCFADRQLDGFRRSRADDTEIGILAVVDQPDDADFLLVAEPVGAHFAARHDGDFAQIAVSLDDERHHPLGIGRHEARNIREQFNSGAIDEADDVALLKTGDFRGASGLHLADHRVGDGAAIGHERDGEDDDCQKEIRQRPGDDNRGTLADTLVGKAHGALRFAHGVPCAAGSGADASLASPKKRT